MVADDTPQAESVLEKLREEHVPLSEGLQQIAAEVAYQNAESPQDFQSADGSRENRLRPVRESRSASLAGQLRWKAGKDAEPVLRRAITLAPDNSKTWLALVSYPCATDQRDKAIEAIRKIEQNRRGSEGLGPGPVSPVDRRHPAGRGSISMP